VSCREFLSSFAGPDLLVIMSDAASTHIETLRIEELYPHPSIYREVSLMTPGHALLMMSLGWQDPSWAFPSTVWLSLPPVALGSRCSV
jgi:hypothetical protein